MDCSSCYVLKSRRLVGVADVGFDDAADGVSEFSDKMSLAHEQKVQGIAETMKMDGKQNLSWKASMLSSQDDDFLLPGSSKLHTSTSEGTAFSGKMGLSESRTHKSGSNGSEGTAFSGKMGLSESRTHKSGSNGTSNAIDGQKVPRMSSMLGTAGMAGFGKAVEILDTIGCLMTTLSPDGGFISRTKTKGVQSLVSDDMSQLMQIVANDKREELKMFSQEIIRFGNRCKDPQWHNLDRYFLKLESESAPQKQLKETAIAEMQKMMTLVQRTTVVEKLVDVVQYIHIEINNAFGSPAGGALSAESTVSCQRLGPAGLALHYANIIIQIYSIITIDQIRARLDSTLKWLVPMAINTTWTDRVGRRPGQADPIETLYHADKARTEAYLLDLVVWLHHLVSQSSRLASARDN
ncbi:hypothetical protein PR202_ga20298 [Eleusine coracana subsp. coracana]|uniref:Uncharacterized protein n=1 Tax=Eleusine coracana subsp. coracana TaxID=191504 RepID=A0AAV5CXH6_ELECO|nr:hypothetical protein PR202_ga20298 [Eleusine coracana subsp. coracana]